MLRKSFVAAFFGLVVAIVGAGAAVREGHEMIAGPENHGLRLKLSITTEAQDVYSVKLDLFNVGAHAVALVSEWPYEELKGDYAEFLKSKVVFETYPEVRPPTAQTAGTSPKSPQPKVRLQPRDMLTVQWRARGRALKPMGTFDMQNTTPYFPGPGLYGVRARVLVVTEERKRILLFSNEEMVSVGGSIAMPKYATGRIISCRPEKKTVMINLGSVHGIREGDEFLIRWGLSASWHMTITKVGVGDSEGTVKKTRHRGRSTPLFPKKHWIARLMPAKDDSTR